MSRRGAALLCLLAWPGLVAAAEGDRRSQELVRYACSSRLGGDDLTLFANGTLRLWQRAEDEEEMKLAELSPDELDAFLARLAAENLAEAESPRFGPGGEWVEQCSLDLELEEREPRRFRFGRYDSLGLTLSRVVGIARELVALAEERGGPGGLPAGYQPRQGDLLLRRDGQRFEVVAYTWDGAGLEMRSLDQPIVLYIPADALAMEFDALLERGPE